MEIITAKNVVAYTTQPDSLDMDVIFAHMPDQFIPFTARKDDSATHGRELYMRAIFGEFGDITTRDPPAHVPSETELLHKLDTLLSEATLRITPLQDAAALNVATIEELTRLDALQRYRIALMRLPQGDVWPTDVTWPDAPQ